MPRPYDHVLSVINHVVSGLGSLSPSVQKWNRNRNLNLNLNLILTLASLSASGSPSAIRGWDARERHPGG